MAVEPRRGCGFRKVGGLYLVCPPVGHFCDRLPIPLTVCPVCNQGIKQARGWTWVVVEPLVEGVHKDCADDFPCPLCMAPHEIGRAGMLWVGEKFYTPGEFLKEASRLGVSKRISAIPHGFEVGKTWVLLAHPEVDRTWSADGSQNPVAGIFMVFRPSAIEKIITQSQSRDEKAMDDLRKRCITAVVVPDDDPDHKGTAYDKEAVPASLPL